LEIKGVMFPKMIRGNVKKICSIPICILLPTITQKPNTKYESSQPKAIQENCSQRPKSSLTPSAKPSFRHVQINQTTQHLTNQKRKQYGSYVFPNPKTQSHKTLKRQNQ
jgi:hypothetical protein